MIKYLSFYFSLDIFVKSFNVLALIVITPLVSQNSQILITNYTVMFTLLMSIFTLSQLGLIPKSTNLKGDKLEFDLSVIFLGLLPLLLILLLFISTQNYLYSLACIAAASSFLYQSYQSGNNIHLRLRAIFNADLIWITSTILVILLLLYFGIKDENLRILSHLSGLLTVSLIFFSSRFRFKENILISMKKNIVLGSWMTIYAGFQWFLVYGDKLMLNIADLNSNMISIFMMTNILQLQLLGGLAILKASKAKILELVLNKDFTNLLSLAKLHILLSLFGIFICIFIYISYVKFLEIEQVDILSISIYGCIYLSISILYFFYQLVVFLDKQEEVSKKLLAFILPIMISTIFLFLYINTEPVVLQFGFLFSSIILLVITRNVAIKTMLKWFT